MSAFGDKADMTLMGLYVRLWPMAAKRLILRALSFPVFQCFTILFAGRSATSRGSFSLKGCPGTWRLKFHCRSFNSRGPNKKRTTDKDRRASRRRAPLVPLVGYGCVWQARADCKIDWARKMNSRRSRLLYTAQW